MSVQDPFPAFVLYYDSIAVSAVNAGKDDTPGAGGTYRGSDRNCDIGSAVKDVPAAAEGINAPPDTGSDYTVDRQCQVGPGRKGQGHESCDCDEDRFHMCWYSASFVASPI